MERWSARSARAVTSTCQLPGASMTVTRQAKLLTMLRRFLKPVSMGMLTEALEM